MKPATLVNFWWPKRANPAGPFANRRAGGAGSLAVTFPAVPSWQVVIDWDSDGGLLVADFESGLDNWNGQTFGTVKPLLFQSTARAYHGEASLLVSWAGGAAELVQCDVASHFVVGRSYTATARVYVPSVSGRHVVAAVAGIGFGSTSSVTDQWTEVSIAWTATSTTHLFQLWASGTPVAGDQTWVDFVRVLGAGEDVSGLERVPWDSPITITTGRDKARALAPSSPGTAAFELDNLSKDYTVENASSPLAGYLGPGRAVAIVATYSGKAYTLFPGYLDDYDVDPDPGTWLASFSALDGLGRLKAAPASTALYSAVRTGQAIHYLLDAIGWTGGRDIDPGASTLLWWWLEADDALDELRKILVAEGPGALAYVGRSREFVFRDRHHRLTRPRSTTAQATFRDSGSTEPLIEQGLRYSTGWKEIINSVELSITERVPAAAAEKVWEDATFFTVSPGETVALPVKFDDPVYGVVLPTQGTEAADDPDILRVGATAVTAALSRTSGQSLLLTLSVAPSAGSAAQIRWVRLRGQPVTSGRTLKVIRQNPESIRKTGGTKPYRPDTPWLNRYDGDAIADLVLGQRAEPLPTVSFPLRNSNSATLTQQLQRMISDRVRNVFTAIGMVADCFIEQIQYEISDGGTVLTTVFACEKIRPLPGNVFRFDVAGAGFDDGMFAPSGLDDPARIFRFDVAAAGFDDGLFAT